MLAAIGADRIGSAAVVLRAGEVFAGFVIEAVLGAGGMGVVYTARHPRMQRLVALKVLNDTLATDPRARAAFDREAELASRLDHPNIVTVYDRSAPGDPVLWLAMRHIPGGDAGALLTREPAGLPPQLAVELIADAGAALDYAHSHGVLHRDVKPGNLLVEHDPRHGYRALLTDFGIARTMESTVTLSGISASFAYTAPERFTGRVADHRSDVYSLGCTLFHLLTGQHPFPRTDQAAVVGAHLSEPPPAPSRARAGLAAGLDEVIAIALAKDPDHRYPHCTAVADAARAALTTPAPPATAASPGTGTAPEPSATLPYNPGTRPYTVTPPIYDRNASTLAAEPRPLPPVRTSTGRPETPPPAATGSLVGRIGRRRLLVGAAITVPLAAATATGIAVLRSLTPPPRFSGNRYFELSGHEGVVNSVAFSPGGSLLATGSDDQTVRVWDTATRQPVGQPLKHTARVFGVAFNHDGTVLAAGSTDGKALLWDIATRATIGQPFDHTDYAESLAYNRDGTLLAIGGLGPAVHLWDLTTRKLLGQLSNSAGSGFTMAFTPDGTVLATGLNVQLWDVATRTPVGQPLDQSGKVISLAFNPNGTLLATASATTVRLWDVATRKLVGPPLDHTDLVTSVVFDPAGTLVATGDSASTTRVWDVATRQPIAQLISPKRNEVASIAFNRDSTLLAVSTDRTVRLFM